MVDKIEATGVRQPAVAGMFYPHDPAALRSQIDSFFGKVEEKGIEGEVISLISPHAGYMYSGQVAAAGYREIMGKDFRVVAIIAPSHQEYFSGISVYTGSGYETPLGIVGVDKKLAQALIAQHQNIVASLRGHQREHSLEVQLPFLQSALDDFRIIPIVLGEQDFETSRILGEALAQVLKGEKALIVASSDLSHYYHYEQAVRLDSIVTKHVEAFDYEGLWTDIEHRVCEACGAGAMIAAMIASRTLGANRAQVLLYQNSGDVTGDKSQVVGYLSAIFYRSPVT